jgi:hypothetical protein
VLAPPQAPVETIEVPAGLEGIKVLSPFGIFFYRPGCVCVCINCRHAVRQSHIHGHLGDHPEFKKAKHLLPKKEVISRALMNLSLIGEREAVKLPAGPIPPFPFLDLPRDKQGHPLGRYCLLCDHCCTSDDTMRRHLNNPALHPDRQEDLAKYPINEHFTRGFVQRFFVMLHGSAYFRVDPLLLGVQKDSDFDIFYSSTHGAQNQSDAPSPETSGTHNAGNEPWDLTPYLARTGWLEHLRGYSWSSMIRSVGALRRDEPEYLQRLPNLAQLYYKSVSSAEVVQLVHPSNLSRLSHWKP